MCCPERILGCICLKTDVIVSFVGLQFADHLTFPILTLGFRRMLLKGHFGGKNVNSGKLIVIYKKIVCLLFGCYFYIYRIQVGDERQRM
jgi:hypothetical protein